MLITLQNMSEIASTNDIAPYGVDACLEYEQGKRQEIISFIKNGYQKSFNADIDVTYPVLLYIEEKSLKAALGIRGSDSSFFVDHYLDSPVLDYLTLLWPSAKQYELVEIGNLYSNAKRFTIPLFLVMAITSYLLGKRYLVLSGTEQILDLLMHSGVVCHDLAPASPHKLGEEADRWGCYYLGNPRVAAIDLVQVMSMIKQNPFYQKILPRLSDKIVLASQKLIGQL